MRLFVLTDTRADYDELTTLVILAEDEADARAFANEVAEKAKHQHYRTDYPKEPDTGHFSIAWDSGPFWDTDRVRCHEVDLTDDQTRVVAILNVPG